MFWEFIRELWEWKLNQNNPMTGELSMIFSHTHNIASIATRTAIPLWSLLFLLLFPHQSTSTTHTDMLKYCSTETCSACHSIACLVFDKLSIVEGSKNHFRALVRGFWKQLQSAFLSTYSRYQINLCDVFRFCVTESLYTDPELSWLTVIFVWRSKTVKISATECEI